MSAAGRFAASRVGETSSTRRVFLLLFFFFYLNFPFVLFSGDAGWPPRVDQHSSCHEKKKKKTYERPFSTSALFALGVGFRNLPARHAQWICTRQCTTTGQLVHQLTRAGPPPRPPVCPPRRGSCAHCAHPSFSPLIRLTSASIGSVRFGFPSTPHTHKSSHIFAACLCSPTQQTSCIDADPAQLFFFSFSFFLSFPQIDMTAQQGGTACTCYTRTLDGTLDGTLEKSTHRHTQTHTLKALAPSSWPPCSATPNPWPEMEHR